MSKQLYKITITNWAKYNKNVRKSYRKIMLSERFLDDNKIRALTPGGRLLFLSCLLGASGTELGCAELSTDTILAQTGVKAKTASTYLQQLQELQLLTYEIFSPFNKLNKSKVNERELNESKEKRSKEKVDSGTKIEQPFPQPSAEAPVKKSEAKSAVVWEAYRNAYFERYKVNPIRNRTVNSQLCSFVDAVGNEEGVEIIKFYLNHQNSYYVRNTHAFGPLLKDVHTIRTQWLKGKQITQADVRRFEKNQENRSLLEDIERNGI